MREYVNPDSVIRPVRRDALTIVVRAITLLAIYADCQNGCTGEAR